MKIIYLVLALACTLSVHAQRVIPLYQGKAPGSESSTWPEKETSQSGARFVYNVTTPTLTAYLPAPGTATGTAVVVCPGGGFHLLDIDNEGTNVAKWLQARGVAAFVLKYRLVHITGPDPAQQMMPLLKDWNQFNAVVAPVVAMDIADGKRAIEYVRSHARELGVQPNRVGLMGFSAGGTVTAGVGYGYSAANRPDFLASQYAYLAVLPKQPVPADAPPLFVAAASDDDLGLAPQSVQLYSGWQAAGKPAELHVYAKGGHGFGTKTQHLPVDSWLDRFGAWLAQQGFPIAAAPVIKH
ncbi:alpha/beta hydrolase [Hymenobacter sp. M29]|uniref:Alpha/beta hydrolase n=1 Tax=Hymenobacter mellowenesis TaxID=3063995 RepID=A0ABT9AFL9_9BACT|nr:alpha/beta hydrolase [Hymenobacter sp. M29]MDO7848619.1 alpha/beta hydrolase [Hymenobacter sp. M29]